ncbi:MAG: synthase subunit b [Deltaproteobacteria bacterium]|jgi:F-type H+-transporting ATPase subunit b|nr:synthase subunit b [Deltaproteobacteria bacterium]
MSEGPVSVLLKFVNFGVMVAILYKFAAKPFKDFLRNRQASVKDKLNESERLLAEARNLKTSYERRLAQLDQEIETFRKTALEEAEKEKARILAEARVMADRIREQAQLAYDQEMRDAMAGVRAEIASRTLVAAEKNIKELFKEEDHSRMVDEFIEKLRGHRGHN